MRKNTVELLLGRLRDCAVLATAALALTGCGGGGGESADGQAATLPAGSSDTPAPSGDTDTPAGANHAPTISGTAVMAVQAGSAYSFKPTAADADGDALGFSIANKPSWATFNSSTGQLSGTPSAAQVGSYANVTISVSDGEASASLAAFTIAVNAAGTGSGTANSKPTISGGAVTSVNAGAAYSFKPTATDANGDALTFSIQNKPAWAAFNTTTGQLSGTPSAANVGSYSGIVISVTDGKSSAVSLPAFAIAVTQISTGSATLSWQPPTQNTDGSTLANLDGYKIYYGTSAGTLNQVVDVGNAGLTTYVVQNLTSGTTYYFALKAYTTDNAESDMSNVASKKVM